MILTQYDEVINVNLKKGKEWFRNLEHNPDKYIFDTHQKLEIISGKIGEVGCIIETVEKIGLTWVTLQFEFIDVHDDYFRIISLSDKYPIICSFIFIERDTDKFKLNISVSLYRDALLLNNHFAEVFINRQIRKELNNIKKILENE